MEYTILKDWCLANRNREFQIETCSLSSEFLILHGKKTGDLVFNRTKGDPFPCYYERKNAAPDAVMIWQQLRFGKLREISIAKNDRIISFLIDTDDIYQQVVHYRLIFECAPGHPNAILCKIQSGEAVIQDALEKYGYADNPQRQILPNLPYTPPQTSYQPEHKPLSYPLILKSLSGAEIPCADANSYMISYYQEILIARQAREESRRQLTHWEAELKKQNRKLSQQQGDLDNAEKAELWHSYAEAIKYNIAMIKPGQTELKAIDYLDPTMPEITIPLLADRSPKDNMFWYIKRYQKAKKGLEIIRSNMQATREEISKLQEIISRIKAGESVPMLNSSRGTGISIHNPLDILDKLLRLKISSDFEIVIGRKAKENDFISTKLGRPYDWWFHTRIYHGSHILLRCLTKKEPDPELIRRCCSLAAWYSKAKFSSNVPVDYTQIRYVRKPRKSAPGFVIYTNQQTVYAEPADIRAIRAELGL